MSLYHFTCEHSYRSILAEQVVRPSGVKTLAGRFAWFTDLPACEPDILGLTSRILTCNRMEHRFTVDPEHIRPWMSERLDLPWHLVQMLEDVPGVMPRHWYVATEPVRVLS